MKKVDFFQIISFAITLLFTLYLGTANTQVHGGVYVLQVRQSGKAVDVRGGSRANQANIQQYSMHKGPSQRFRFISAGDGTFYIRNDHSMKYFDIAGRSRANQANLQQFSFHGATNQRFRVKKAPNGYVFIQNKNSGRFLDVVGRSRANNANIQQYSFHGGANQQFKLIKVSGNSIPPSSTNRKMTTFSPLKHGFKFNNSYKTTWMDVAGIKIGTDGLCGGMSYAAADYFRSNKKVPSQDYRPAIGTSLYNYFKNRQWTSISMPNTSKWAELAVNPFGLRDEEFFYWGLEDRLRLLKNLVDKNLPVPLGLFHAKNGSDHHQVLAIGYDLGGYKWKREKDPNRHKVRIYVYDPNYPGKVCALVPNPSKKYYDYQIGKLVNGQFKFTSYLNTKKWRTYFVDKDYKRKTPPTFNPPPPGNKNYIYRLRFAIRTGGDDLRGGKDNLNIHVYLKNGKIETFRRANEGKRWPDNTTQIVEMHLSKPIKVTDISKIRFETTFSGGIGGDNWNMNNVSIKAIKGNHQAETITVKKKSFRFTGSNRWLSVYY